MTEQNKHPAGQRILKLEQAEMEVADIARVIASYYTTLKEEGLSDAIAAQLTNIFSQVYWGRILGKGSKQ